MSKNQKYFLAFVVVALGAWIAWWLLKRKVYDAGNSKQLSDLFDQQNPDVPGVAHQRAVDASGMPDASDDTTAAAIQLPGMDRTLPALAYDPAGLTAGLWT